MNLNCRTERNHSEPPMDDRYVFIHGLTTISVTRVSQLQEDPNVVNDGIHDICGSI